jgi:hypothetical protein
VGFVSFFPSVIWAGIGRWWSLERLSTRILQGPSI